MFSKASQRLGSAFAGKTSTSSLKQQIEESEEIQGHPGKCFYPGPEINQVILKKWTEMLRKSRRSILLPPAAGFQLLVERRTLDIHHKGTILLKRNT